MLLLLSSIIICQTTNTNLTNCFSDAQVNEIYKGLKQGEYLKERLYNTEEVLSTSEALNIALKEQLDNMTEVNEAQKQLLKTKEAQKRKITITAVIAIITTIIICN